MNYNTQWGVKRSVSEQKVKKIYRERFRDKSFFLVEKCNGFTR